MNLLITGAWRPSPNALQALSGMGHVMCFMEREDGPLPCPGDWVEGTVCNRLFLTHPVALLPRLRYVQLTSAGCDRVPVEELAAQGVVLHTARGVYSGPMAEFALWGVLTIYKDGVGFLDAARAHCWTKRRGLREMTGKYVLVLGCGSVGTACAERFAAMGCHVRGIDLYAARNTAPCGFLREAGFDEVLPPDRLDSLLPETDILLLALPLTPDTAHCLDVRRLALLPEGAVVVNLSRGAVLDEAALEAALRQGADRLGGALGGAVLDVCEEEPLPPHSTLWDCPGVLLTPHNSFVGEGNEERLEKAILDGLRKQGTVRNAKE